VSANFANQAASISYSSGYYYYTLSNCATASITSFSFPDISTSVLVPRYKKVEGSFDSVSGVVGVFKCGPFSYNMTKTIYPGSFIDASMGKDFYWWPSNNQSNFWLNPTHQPEEVGNYVIQL
jgi:hypothetical protein